MKKTTAVILFFVAAVLAGLFLQWSYRPSAVKPVAEDETSPKETFKQREVGMPLDMQSVEGAVGVAGYSGTPPLLGSEPKPVSEKPYDMANDTELFEFQNNKVGADCCPSPFSSDLGCICLTEEQRKKFETRAGNRAPQ